MTSDCGVDVQMYNQKNGLRICACVPSTAFAKHSPKMLPERISPVGEILVRTNVENCS